jgi:hypothetical protein
MAQGTVCQLIDKACRFITVCCRIDALSGRWVALNVLE